MGRPFRPAAVAACLAAAWLVSAAAAGAGPWYVRGSFYCHAGVNDPGPGTDCWGWDAGNEMFDDGLHGDGFPDDGVFGARVVCTEPAGRLEWKIALSDWSEAYPSSPVDALANAVLFTDGPGDTIHFRLDTNVDFAGWHPFSHAVATDHALPPGAALEVIGSMPETANWTFGEPMALVAGRWQRVLTIATPGSYEYKLRVQGTWDVAAFGWHYNNTAGLNDFFTTTLPNADVLFQLDLATGRIRALELGVNPARPSSWGAVKATYR